MPSGVLLVDKPGGPTSHGVVSATRKALGLKKVGHAGTLDPMATGLLVLGVGQATKLLTYFVGLDKTYRATIRLGYETSTDDAEGEIRGEKATDELLDSLDASSISRALQEQTGEILQVPSSVSAIRVDGQRAYERARQGQEVDLPPRPVTVYSIEVDEVRRVDSWWEVDVEVACSSGTYIRAIARDLGRRLGVGGHLVALRRTRVGPFGLDDACLPGDISGDRLMSPALAAGRVLPIVHATSDQVVELGHGKKVFLDPPADADAGSPVAVLSPEERLVAICEILGGVARVIVGFPEQEGAA